MVDSIYTVQKGDTLTGIVVKLGLAPAGGTSLQSWAPAMAAAQQIADKNGIPDPNQIEIGQQLAVPGAPDPNGTENIVTQPSVAASAPPSLFDNPKFVWALSGALVGLVFDWGFDDGKHPLFGAALGSAAGYLCGPSPAAIRKVIG